LKKLLFLLLLSPLANALDLQCDKVEVTALEGGVEVPGTYEPKWHTFKGLIPDQNQTYMDGDSRISIQWSDVTVTINEENTWFELNSGWSYTFYTVINRKDFTWSGYHSYKEIILMKGLCKIWEKPSDNAF